MSRCSWLYIFILIDFIIIYLLTLLCSRSMSSSHGKPVNLVVFSQILHMFVSHLILFLYVERWFFFIIIYVNLRFYCYFLTSFFYIIYLTLFIFKKKKFTYWQDHLDNLNSPISNLTVEKLISDPHNDIDTQITYILMI